MFAPTKAAYHLNEETHSPQVHQDNHGAEVDIWGVGRLLTSAPVAIPDALHSLEQRMIDGDITTAELTLGELRNIVL